MKKGLKIATASFLAVSALVPVTAFAAEQTTAADGFYTATKFYTTAEFQALSPAEKKAIIKEGIKSKSLVIVMGGKVFDTSNIAVLTATDATFESTGITYEAFVASGKDLSKTGGIVTPKPPVTGELKVESVSAINAGELVVKFTSPIDAAIATKDVAIATGYKLATNDILTLDGSALPATQPVSLSKDGKTLTIVAQGTQNFVGGHTLVVAPDKVKDADSNKHIEGGKFEFTLSADKTRPTLVSTTYKDAKTVVATFSEPIKSLSTAATANFVYADGTAVTTGGVTQTALVSGSKTVEYKLDSTMLTAGKDIKVTYTDAEDFNGNVISPVSTTFKFTADTTKPVASTISAVSSKQFTIQLSKDVDTVDVAKIKLNNVVLTPTALNVAPTATGQANYSIDNTTKLVTINLFDAQTGVVPIVIGADAFVDAVGNKSDAIASQLVNFKTDTVAPTLVSSEVKSINNKQHLLLTFSENVTAKTLTASIATFTYDDENGVSKTIVNNNTLATSLYQPVSGKSKVVAVDLTTVTNGTDSLNTNSSAKVTFAPGFVSDLFGNDSATIKDVAFKTSHTGATAPRLEVTTVVAGANPGTVDVSFNERLDITSARDVNNYKINGVAPKEAIIIANTSGAVTVQLVAQDDSLSTTGNYDVVISGVKASSSNVLQQLTKSAALTITENVRPTVKTVEVVSLAATPKSELKVTFSESVKETVQNGDYDLYVNGTKVVAATTTGATVFTAGTSVTFEVATDLTTVLAQSGSTVELRKSLTNDITDANGNKVNADVIKIK